MNANEYQRLARTTAIYPRKMEVIYPALGLAGETGEVLEKIKKWIRDGHDIETVRANVKKEGGDVLWYLANLLSDLDLTLDEVMEANVAKLADRAERGVLKGSGDNR